MRRYMTIVDETMFSRWRQQPAAPTRNPKFQDLDDSPLEFARQCRSAEEYAERMNPINTRTTDPDSLHDRARWERQRLINQWTHWDRLGMLN